MPFDGYFHPEFDPGAVASRANRVHPTRSHLKPAAPSHSIDATYTAAAAVDERYPAQDLTAEQKNAINSPWDEALAKAEKEKTLCPNEVEAKLKAVAAKAMLIIFARGAEKNTDPAIMRALMRDIMQEINRFRVEFHNAQGPNAQVALHAGIGDLDRRLTKKAFHLQGKLRRELEQSHTNVSAMATSMGFKPHHMDDSHDWLSAHHHDHEHTYSAGFHG